MSDELFDLPPAAEAEKPSADKPPPRLRTANRAQIELRAMDLEGLLPLDHQARVVWDFVEGLDLSPLYDAIDAVEGGPGHAATDPKILMALWLYATLDGVGSARALDRLTREHDAYRWICGGVSVNYHLLADFRVGHMAVLDAILTASVATLTDEGLVEMKRVAQDGMRVRASAGAASFRRKATLKQRLKDAEEQVATLRRELDEDPAATSRRQQAARRRAAEERRRKVAEALKRLPEAEAKKKKKADKGKARVSTTDPEATVMKMGDGGFRPAYNAQFATDTQSQVIIGVEVVNIGSDQGQLQPMVQQLQYRYGRVPDDMLVDGGFVSLDDIEEVTDNGCTVYAPVTKPRDTSRDPFQPLATDSPVIASWRKRKGTADAKVIYKERAPGAECVNAHARNRGLHQLPVRGWAKVRAVLLWHALAQNLKRATSMRAARDIALAM